MEEVNLVKRIPKVIIKNWFFQVIWLVSSLLYRHGKNLFIWKHRADGFKKISKVYMGRNHSIS